MRKALFMMLSILMLISAVYLPDSFAQDAPQGQLFEYPEFVEIRHLSKGVITGDFQYSSDGTKLAISSSVGTWLYDTQAGKELDLFASASLVHSVRFSPDGTTLASVSGRRIKLQDISTGDQLRTIWGDGYSAYTVGFSFSPDGTILASGSSDNTIKLWDVSTGSQLQTLTGHTSDVYSVAFSRDGTTLASGSRDTTIKLWDVSTGSQLQTLTGHTSDVYSVAFSPDGTTLASGSRDTTIKLWDVSTGSQLQTLTGHTSDVYSVAFSPDGTTLASGSRDTTIKLWDVSTGSQLQTLTGHTSDVYSVAFSPDGTTLASGSDDETIKLWDISTGSQLRMLTEHTSRVLSMAFSPDGTTLASGSGDDTIKLWDISTGTHLQTLTRHSDDVFSVSFSPDGSILASGSWDDTIKLWDVSTGTHLQTLAGHTSDVYSVAFSPDGSILASGSADDTIKLWDVSTGNHLQTLREHSYSVSSVGFSPDSSILASGSRDATIKLWDVSTGKHLQTLAGHTSNVYSVAFSPDGTTLASGSGDATIKLWDVSTGKHLQTLTKHTSNVYSVAFSPDGTTLASGSGDDTIKLWDVSTGNQIQTLTGHTDWVSSVGFSPDGSTLASGSGDRTVFLWELTLPPSDDEVLDDHGNTWAEATLLPIGETRTGVIETAGDIDYFRVDIEAVGELTLYTTGDLNTFGQLERDVDNEDEWLVTKNDNSGSGLNFRISHDVIKQQTYYVKVTTPSNGTGSYTIHARWTPEPDDHGNTWATATPLRIGEFRTGKIKPSGDIDYFRIDIEDLGKLTVYTTGDLDTFGQLERDTGDVTSDDNSGAESNFRIIHDAIKQTYYVKVTELSNKTGSYTIYTDWTDKSDKHGNTRAGATPISFGTHNNVYGTEGEIKPYFDVDYFKVEIKQKGELTVYSRGQTDLVGQLQEAKGVRLATSTNDGEGPNFRIVYNVTPGTYYVKVTELNKDNIGHYFVYAYFTAFEGIVKYPNLTGQLGESVRCVVYSPSGEVLTTGDNSNKIHVWHPITGDKITTLEAKNYGEGKDYGDVRSIAFSPDGNWCAAGTAWQDRLIGDDGGYLIVWKRLADTWAEAGAWGKPQEIQLNATVRSVAFSPDSSLLAYGTDGLHAGTHGAKAYLSRYLSGAQKWDDSGMRELEHDNKNVTSVVWHPNPTMDPNLYLLATGCDDGKVRVWDLTTGANTPQSELFDPDLEQAVHYIVFSPDGKKLAAGHNDGSVILWSERADNVKWTATWRNPFEGKHDGAVLSLAFHPDGNVMVSCGDDRTLSFWDVHTLTSLSGVSQVEHAKISSITFNPLGNALAIGTEGDAQVLDIFGNEVHPRVYQFEYRGTAGFTNEGNFSLNIPSNLGSGAAYSENATYFVLNLQFPKLIEGRAENPIYGDCIITLDLPDVQQAPVSDPNGKDPRLDNPLYFMYSLETPSQRIEAVRAGASVEKRFKMVTTAIGAGVGGGIGFAIGSVLPGAGNIFGAGVGGFVGQLSARVIGSVAGNVVGVGLRKLKSRTEVPAKTEMILAETADPFFLIQPTEDTVLEAETGRPRLDRYRVLFLIEKEITEIGITVEQAYQLKEEGPLYVAKSTHIWNLKGGFGSAPRAQPIALSNYPPFQELPPAEQTYLLQHFGAARNVNAEQLRIPETTTLLPNYPNPFNPETWIPYQLAKPANVTLTIYDINGHVVRELDLGHQRAGVYQSRKRAAYWDGRNTVGEPVASGVYFYALTAGDFTATRKMLIRK